MILKASTTDKKSIYELWKKNFAHDDGGYTDYYFNTYYNANETFVKKIENEVVGCASKHPHSIVLKNRMLQCSMIVGIAVKEEFQHQGYMHELMNTMIDEAEHQELITLIQAYDPEIYQEFGFETVYKQRVWTIKKENIKKLMPQIVRGAKAEDCLILYGKFMSRFNGYYIRDIDYFNEYIKEIEAQKGKVISYYNGSELEGYAVVYETSVSVEVKECIYLSGTALLHIFNYLKYKSKTIYLTTSDAENINLIFPYSEYVELPYTMARLNDSDLFNRLYNVDVKTASEAFGIVEKPLFMSENR